MEIDTSRIQRSIMACIENSKRLFEDADWAYHQASTGLALALLAQEPSDLVLTDVDMPRLDGIELATFIKQDARLRSLPVMIVSYKDREEDRLRGLEAGADYYLTKGSFHDATLLQAVVDLIGEAET